MKMIWITTAALTNLTSVRCPVSKSGIGDGGVLLPSHTQYAVATLDVVLISRYWPVRVSYSGQFTFVLPFGLPVFTNCVQ